MSEKPIQVVHVMPQVGIGGAEKQLLALIANSDANVVRHKVFYYSDSNDTEGFRLYEDASLADSIGQQARKTIEQRYHWAVRAKELSELYVKLVDRKD